MVDTHQACWELLPWMVNGRLGQQELLLVESHLARCEECRAELHVQRHLYEQISRKDALVLAPQSSMQKLMARLDADADVTASSRSVTSDAPQTDIPVATHPVVADETHRSPHWFKYAIASQGALIVVLLGALSWQVGGSLTAPRFTTLTSEPSTIAHGPAIRVVFATDVEMRDVNELLQSLGAQVVAGPGQAGVYTLVLEPSVTPGGDVSAVLTSLRADARVVFAEQAVAAAPTK
jgi:hypothetical protein